ncbi:MAG: hypothetical protein AMXMBFR84_24760 [Candidatus Hydrogenedentota bacterium]
MKIALINPTMPASLKKENLGLAYLAATLEQDGHKVRVIDEIAGHKVEPSLEEFKPDIAGLSFMTMYAPRAYQLSKLIKKRWGIPVIMGGTHPSVLPEEAIQHGDCVIRGEAEWSFPKAITEGKLEGIIEQEAPPDLDALPWPARDKVPLDVYATAGEEICGVNYRALGVITSRGCPFRCEYCINSRRETQLRYHGADRVIEEIKFLSDRYNIQSIAFYDELMATHIDRFREICERLIDTGLNKLKWECQIHARRIRPDLVPLMKRAGCIQVNIGFESGSQRMLDRMQKDCSVEINERAAALLREGGIRVRGSFIIGTPGETMADVMETEKFIKRAQIDFASIHYLTPYPGTALYDEFKKDIHAANIGWEKFTAGDPDTFNCNPAMSPAQQKKMFLRLSARSALRNYPLTEMVRLAMRNPRHAMRTVANLF